MTKVPKKFTRWLHLKRGSEYRVVGRVRIQCSTQVPKDGAWFTLYVDDDGVYSARHPDEFLDGRFVQIK